jgi:hypothetical protein
LAPVISVVLAMALGATESSAAEPLPVAVRISESLHEGCPTTPGMRERLESHLGHLRQAGPGEPAIDLAVGVERRAGVSRGTLTLSFAGVSVHRNASSTSCEDVIGALSMMAAIAIGEEAERFTSDVTEQPSVEVTTELPASASTSPSSAKAAPPRVQGVSPRPGVPPRGAHGKRLAAAVGAGFEINGNRGAVLVATWFAQLTLPAPFDPALRVGVARSSREAVSSPRGVVAIRWSELTLAGCADLLRERGFRVGPCLNVELGRLEASVVVPRPTLDVSYLWLSLGASAKVAWRPLPRFSVEMMVGVRSPVMRKELFFEPYGDPVAYRAPAISPFMGIGFVAHLP